MRVERFLENSAQQFGDKTALVADGRRLSFVDLDAQASAFARALADNGIVRGDRVLVFVDNCWEAAVAIFGTLKAGAVFSPINPSTKASKLAYVIDDCSARAVVVKDRLATVLADALTEATAGPLAIITGGGSPKLPDALSFNALLETPPAPVAHGGIDIDLGMLIYTSGSTGRPKGVMMTHRNIDAASESITTYLENTPDDIILNVLPLAFDYGLYQLLMAVRIGATLVLEKAFVFPQAVFERIREEKATGLPLVPTMAAMILSSGLEPGSLPSLRYVTNTAAALPPEHIAKLRALMPGTTVYSMYGLTECKRCTYLPPAELERKSGSVGIAIPNTEAFVVDESGKPVAPGVTGELAIRGPHVMAGYWGNDEATAKALHPGLNPWEKMLMTGDLFYADADGFLFFVGRKDDIIKTRGEKVAPKEVEAVLHGYPGVSEAVVVGKPDPVLGHAIHAIVVPTDDSVTERDIIRHCAKKLEDFMVPKSVEFRTELPKTDTGKVSRRLAAQSLEDSQ